MKISRVYIYLFLLISLISCENDAKLTKNIDPSEFNTDLLIKEFAHALAKSSIEPELLNLIRDETNKQFDYDYDVLYRFIKEKKIKLSNENEMTVKQLLFSNFSLDGYGKSIDMEDFEILYESIPNLNICIPFQYKDWQPNDYIPNIAHFPVDWDDDTHKGLETFDVSGKSGWLPIFEDIVDPIITVGLSERVDNDGKIKVTQEGFIIPKEDRIFDADEAYQLASSYLKSDKSYEYPGIIQIMPDDFFINERKANNVAVHDIYSDLPVPPVKSVNAANAIAAPEIVKIVPSSTVGNSIQLTWQSESCEKYKIWYRKDGGSWNTIEQSASTPPTRDIGSLTSGAKYTFFVQAYKDASWSAYSNYASLRAGWRDGYGQERLVSIYMDKKCWNDISWARSKAEFYLKVVKFNHSNGTFEFPNVNLGQKNKSDIVDKTYTFNKNFFTWDMDQYASNYWLYFYEEDGGNPVEITLGVKVTAGQKVKVNDKTETTVGAEFSASVKFTVGGRDDKFGFLEIYNYTSDDIVSSNPPKGNCRVKITQY